MTAILIYTKTMLKRFLRDPIYLFFIFAFPLIFLFIFGTIFGGNSTIKFNVAIFNNADNQFAKNFVEEIKQQKDSPFDIKTDVKDLTDAKEQMARGELDSIIELPASFGRSVDEGICNEKMGQMMRENPGGDAQKLATRITECLPSGQMNVYYDPAQSQSGQTVATILSGILDDVNTGLTGVKPPLSVAQVSTGKKGMSQFDFTFAGLFAYTLMSMSIYTLSQQLPGEKKSGALRRIQATGFRPWQLITALSLTYFVMTALSAGVMCAVGVLAFHWQMQGSWLVFMLFGTISVLALSGFGMLIAGAARSANQATMASQLTAFPMMFLSGVFIPLFIMPPVFQAISHFIPLTPVAEGLRLITTENAGLMAVLPQIGLISLWGLAAYLVAFRVFKWE